MSDYRRWISYLYSYEGGNKGKSAGYARLERRNNRVRMTLYLDNRSAKKWMVYYYCAQNEGMRGIFLGTVDTADGREFRHEADCNRLAESGYKLKEISGILLLDEDGGYLASSWTDEEPDHLAVGRLYRELTEDKKNEEESIPEGRAERETESSIEDKAGNLSNIENIETENIETENTETENIETERLDAHDSEKHHAGERDEDIAEDTPRSEEPVKKKETERNQEHNMSNHQEQMPYQWSREERVFRCLTPMYPFEDGEFEKSVRMEPQDIGMLPRTVWKLSGNSFLLHSYYTYRHLLFVCKRGRDEKKCYLMLPGVYEKKEQYMAQMFGFGGFRPAKSYPLDNGSFGYWYMEIKFESSSSRE